MYRQWFLILWVNRNSIQFQFEDECGECFLHFQLFMVPIWICKSLISSVLLKRVACSFQSTIHLGGILPSQFKCTTFVSQFIPYFLVSQFSPYFFLKECLIEKRTVKVLALTILRYMQMLVLDAEDFWFGQVHILADLQGNDCIHVS